MNQRQMLGSISLLLLLGCGSNPFTVNGSIRGNSLKSGDAVSATGSVALGGSPINAGVVVLSNTSGLCGLAVAGKEPKNSQFLILVVSDRNTNTAPTGAGSYVIYSSGAQPTKLAIAQYFQTDASCHEIQSTLATSGTITLTSVSNGNLSGTFDLTFDTGDHVSGSFSAANCSALIFVLANPNPTCG